MRKMMTKQITKTDVKIARMLVEDGTPKAIELPNKVILGNVSLEKAQRIIDKEYRGLNVIVLEVNPNTFNYELEVEKFMEIATIKGEEE
jgi:hypothetical protein